MIEIAKNRYGPLIKATIENHDTLETRSLRVVGGALVKRLRFILDVEPYPVLNDVDGLKSTRPTSCQSGMACSVQGLAIDVHTGGV